jgi:hypothetical protein
VIELDIQDGAVVARSPQLFKRLLILAGLAIAVVLGLTVASAFAGHGRGTNVAVSVSPSGIATVVLDQRVQGSCTVGQVWGSGSVTLYSMPSAGGARTDEGTFNATAYCTRKAGTFIETRATITIDMSSMPDGWYVVRHTSGAKVSNIINVNGGSFMSSTDWSSESQFRKTTGQQTGSPGFGVQLPFAASIGYEYNQNLVAVDPDGGAVVANTMCCVTTDPDLAVTYDVINVTGTEVVGQQIVIPSSVTGTLSNGQYIEFKVRVTDNDGEYSEVDMVLSPTTNAPPALTPPAQTTLPVTGGSSTQVPLSATDPDTGQTVTFSLSGQPSWITLSQTPGNPATGGLNVNPPATTHGTFVFNVNATDNASGLPATSSFTMTVVVVGVPDAPTSVVATPGDGEIAVAWVDPVDDGGSAIIGYQLQYRPVGSSDAYATLAVTSGPATIPGLTSDVEYEVVVRAVTANGVGAGTTVTATPYSLAGAPGAVQDLATVVSSEHVTLSWTPPADDGGAAITGYRVEVRKVGDAGWTTVTTTTDTSVVVSGLERGTDHEFRVVASNSEGDGPGVVATATTLHRRPTPGATVNTTIRSGEAVVMPVYTGPGVSSVSIAATGSGLGSWSTSASGEVFTAGDAPFHGALSGEALNAPITSISPTPSGGGYYLVGRDGGVFAFGDATFLGSTSEITLNQQIEAIVPTCRNDGYYLVGRDGGVFAFGAARFLGSMGGTALNRDMLGIVPNCTGNGYWTFAADGGVFSYGDAEFHGSLGDDPPASGVAAMVPTSDGHGYWLIDGEGHAHAFGSAVQAG